MIKGSARSWILRVLLGVVFTSSAFAVEKEPEQLRVLRVKFQIAQEKIQTKVAADVAEFEKRYIAELKQLQEKATQAGNLAKVLAVKAELTTFHTRPPASKKPSPLPEVLRLQKIYDEQKQKLNKAQKAKLAPLFTIYRKQLADLITKLTTSGDIDGAIAVRLEADKTDSQLTTKLNHKGISGRYIRLDVAGEKRCIQVAELQIFDNEGKNIAKRGKATQSPVKHDPNLKAANAIDGNTDGDINHRSICFFYDTDPWWEVDLGEEHGIAKMVFWSRTWFQNRMDGFKISVLDADRKKVWEQTVPKAPKRSLSFDLSEEP